MAESRCSNQGGGQPPRRRGERGFSLIETMVAIVLLTTALVTTAQLLVIATRANMSAQRLTFAATLAQEKMEQLRGLAWGFDDLGLPVSDFTTNITVDPPTNNGVGLQPSPENALASNVVGYVDYVDRHGKSVVGGGANPPATALYVRRWSVEPLPTNPNNTLIFQVLVFNIGDRANNGAGAVLNTVRDEARLVSVKTRKSR